MIWNIIVWIGIAVCAVVLLMSKRWFEREMTLESVRIIVGLLLVGLLAWQLCRIPSIAQYHHPYRIGSLVAVFIYAGVVYASRYFDRKRPE